MSDRRFTYDSYSSQGGTAIYKGIEVPFTIGTPGDYDAWLSDDGADSSYIATMGGWSHPDAQRAMRQAEQLYRIQNPPAPPPAPARRPAPRPAARPSPAPVPLTTAKPGVQSVAPKPYKLEDDPAYIALQDQIKRQQDALNLQAARDNYGSMDKARVGGVQIKQSKAASSGRTQRGTRGTFSREGSRLKQVMAGMGGLKISGLNY